MRHILLLLVYLTSMTSYAQYYIIDTLKLNASYQNLINYPMNIAYQKAFFDAFPSSWVEYANTYIQPEVFQENHSNNDAQPFDTGMSKSCYKHMDAYKHLLNSIPDSLYCSKLVNTSIGASYDADARSDLQEALHHAMEHRRSAMMKIISEMTIADQLKFWLFYWASEFKKIYPKEFEKLYPEMVKTYPEEAATMKIGFDYACGNTFFDTYGHIDKKQFVGEKN